MNKALARTIAANVFCSHAFLPGYKKVIHKARRPHAAVIVNFHQFYQTRGDFLAKGPCVHTSVEHFDRILKLLRQRFHVISLDLLVDHLSNDEPLKADSVVITMDDGYENNFTLGLPILRKYEIPAILFVATGFIGTPNLMPMDQAEYLLRTTSRKEFTWKPLSNAPISLSNFSHRCDVNNRLGCYLKRLPEPQMRSALDELAELLDVDLHSGGVRMLTWSQIRSFVEAGMDVGSHGVSHICMSRLGKQRAVDELCDSKRLIEKEIGRPVRHFAFPNGTKEDFSDELRQEAKAAGYSSVASAEPGVNVPRSTDPLNLQRVGLIGSPEETLLYLERLFYSSSDRQVAR